MKKCALKTAALLCVLVLVLQCLPLAARARTMGDVRDEIAEGKDKMERILSDISAAEGNRAAALKALDEFQIQYDRLVALIDEQDALIEIAMNDLQIKIDQLSDTRERINNNKALFIERLRAIYEANSTNAMLAVIMSVDSFSGYALTQDVMARIARHDTDLLHLMDAEWDTYEAQRLDLEAQIDQLNADLAELKDNRNWCDEQMEIAKQTIAWADLQIAQSQQEYSQTQDEVDKLEAELDALFWQSQQNGSQQGDGSVKYDGPLAWPVPGHGYVSSVFGDPRGNTRGHYGIDIPAPVETPIVAAAPGTVITATHHWSYGNYIEIDHGGGMRTLYAHCNSLWVGVGAQVSKGDAIAGVGNTGDSKGNHLHFEVHDNGARQDPMGSGYLNG